MNKHLRLLGMSIAALALAGCASTELTPKTAICAVAAGAVGAGLGSLAADGDDEDKAMAITGVAGAAIGYLLCQPQAVAVAPEPTPAPAPVPAPAPMPKPDPDTDGDGVPDSRDDCPDTPRGHKVDARGCPDIPDLTGVHFGFDKATLTPSATAILDEAVAVLQADRSVRVEIVGHTDSVGSDAYNLKLSDRRAASVRDYLVAKGVAASRISSAGKGESEPVASNDTDEGRAQNRRVMLTARPL